MNKEEQKAEVIDRITKILVTIPFDILLLLPHRLGELSVLCEMGKGGTWNPILLVPPKDGITEEERRGNTKWPVIR